MSQRYSLGVLAIVVLVASALPASASPVSWVISGMVARSTVSGVTAGDAFEMSVTFDPDAVDSDPTATGGSYLSIGDPYGFSFGTGSHYYTSGNSLQTLVQNRDPQPGVSGGVDLYSFNNFAFSTGFPLFSLLLEQDTQDQFPAADTMLTSDRLLLTPPQVFGSSSYAYLSIDGKQIIGSGLHVRAVPEPATLALFGLGATVVAVSRRWRS